MAHETVGQQGEWAVERLDDSDHVRGPTAARVVLEYGDYECPYSRRAFRAIELVERRYAAELQLDVARFDVDRLSSGVLARVRCDVESGLATGAVRGTPTLFIDVVHLGSYDARRCSRR